MIFVVDKHLRPLMPGHPARARQLLRGGRAVVHRRVPLTIRLRDRVGGATQPVVIGIDPGSVFTGLALAREEPRDGGAARHALWLGELRHRGRSIRKALQQRAAHRGRRRSALRYRAPRFNNRRRRDGWLAPGLRHRLETTLVWVRRLSRWAPVTRLAVERVRFDIQQLQRPGIHGVEYQQGTLAGFELREYLLNRDGRQCAYCGKTDLPLQLDHVVPKASGGSDRPSNLVLACRACNEAKGKQPIDLFLVDRPAVLARVSAQVQKPLAHAAALNATHWALWRALVRTGLPVEGASGGRTKWNRSLFGVPKAHALDALCVGQMGTVLAWQRLPTLVIAAVGRGAHQRTLVDRYGFPRGYFTRIKRHFGFRSGDLVRATVPRRKHKGTHIGRVAVRARGTFAPTTVDGQVLGDISWRHCRLWQRADGYAYRELKGGPA